MKFNLIDPTDSLEIRDKDNRIIFSSKGHWIIPLLDAKAALQGMDLSNCTLYDTKAGRAAACIAHIIGIREVCIALVSKRALDYYKANDMVCYYDSLVDKLACKTEDLITDQMDDNEILTLLESLNA